MELLYIAPGFLGLIITMQLNQKLMHVKNFSIAFVLYGIFLFIGVTYFKTSDLLITASFFMPLVSLICLFVLQLIGKAILKRYFYMAIRNVKMSEKKDTKPLDSVLGISFLIITAVTCLVLGENFKL